MPPPALLSTPAVRRQNLLIEFASLKHAAPAGVYMSLTPSDPTLWSGAPTTAASSNSQSTSHPPTPPLHQP
ncbi:hypothetical protein P167DRAFT_578186 [Morchella conica CCBAS932]|uniref:Uncharacterized protein n=1 Tax=Morchella conica CCBAS932 TaxID=1392247 RepID=A0A3N4KD96_9PEZI|nr:hypothetical protein P167DRAFT_578186 [Morchella conica CCBAS932]